MPARLAACLLLAANLSGCQVLASSAVTIGLEIAVKAFELDKALIDDIKAHRDAAADPNMTGVIPERHDK